MAQNARHRNARFSFVQESTWGPLGSPSMKLLKGSGYGKKLRRGNRTSEVEHASTATVRSKSSVAGTSRSKAEFLSKLPHSVWGRS